MPSPSPQEMMITAEVIKHKVPCTLLCDRLLLSHLNPATKDGVRKLERLAQGHTARKRQALKPCQTLPPHRVSECSSILLPSAACQARRRCYTGRAREAPCPLPSGLLGGVGEEEADLPHQPPSCCCGGRTAPSCHRPSSSQRALFHITAD